VSLAAINALGVAQAKDATGLLIDLLDKSGSDRRRASALALGELGATSAIPKLIEALSAKDDRVAADAAWALGELAAGSTEAATTISKEEPLAILFRLGKRGGWATAISATGALARIAAVNPTAVAHEHDAAVGLLYHKSRLVRINAARLVGELERGAAEPTKAAVDALVSIVDDDPSTAAKIAAVDALATIAAGKPAKLGTSALASLDLAAGQTRDANLAAAATAAKKAAPVVPPRTEWRSFYVVDPSADDRPVRQEAYFIVGADHLVWATYTDARGEIATEHFPAGDATVLSSSHEDEL
jgi:hypothetical protein